MNKNQLSLSIDPLKGLGFIDFDSNINRIITELKSKADLFSKIDIIIPDQCYNDPIYITLQSEGIKLRFDYNYQKLELIQIEVPMESKRTYTLLYKGNVIINSDSKNDYITFNYISSVFGPSSLPKLIKNNKLILLRYDGISFIFDNIFNETEEKIILGSDAPLMRIAMYSEKTINQSISKDLFLTRNPLIKVENKKGISINEGEITIFFDDELELVLSKLKNPNHIYYKDNNSEYSGLERKSDIYDEFPCVSKDYFLNYYDYGFDLMFDGEKHTLKKIKMYTNNPFSKEFGLYNRCNFNLELSRQWVMKNSVERMSINKENNEIIQNKSRKISDESYYMYQNLEEKMEDEGQMPIKAPQNIIFENPGSDKRNFQSQSQNNNCDKSLSLNESFASSLNNSEYVQGFTITPITNFLEFANKISTNTYNIFMSSDVKINTISKFYVFEGFIFELTENNAISSLLIYNH